MRSVTIAVLLATAAFAAALNPLDPMDDLVASPSSPESASLPPPPVKLDKNLRRALLKALVDLEAESAEQQTDQPVDDEERSTEPANVDENKYDFLEISRQKSSSFSFDGFPSDEETPSEDKLQNSSFVETDKYAQSDSPDQRNNGDQQPPKDYTKGVQVHHIVSSEKASAIYETKPAELLETVESRSIGSTSSPVSSSTSDFNQIQKSVTYAPITETLSVSASGSIASAAANSLVAPRPTAATNLPKATNSTSKTPRNKEEAEDVKIFQAPLVAAFTVQQDERGIPKSVVPLYKSSTGGQPLSLQEQLDFKQRLLEKQLAQLQAQQSQQTQFLIRQRQAYEEQLRQKQQQDYFIQEQRRLQEQQRLQRVQLQQQQQQQYIQQLPRFQQLPQLQQQQSFKATNVQLQPSLSLEVPSIGPAQPFQQGPVRAPLQQQQQPQPQFFPPPQQQAPLARFNRQEAFNSVGNFGFNTINNNNLQQSQPSFVQQRSQEQSETHFRPLRQQYRLQLQSAPGQGPPQHTPARQIQELLYQSGIANDLQGAGTRHLEDINIVSKVLALNVGALPGKHGFQQFTGLKKKK